MAESTPGTDVAVFDPANTNYPVLFGAADGGGLAEIIEENFGDEGFRPSDLPRIKMPAGGGRAWDIEGEPPTAILEGVIVSWHTARSFWFKSLDDSDETTPPDCSSMDGQMGNGEFGPGSAGNPSGVCAECPMNQYGSGGQNSKACKEQRQLFLLQPGAVLPIVISLPPTSLAPFRKYMTNLSSKGLPYYGVTTRLGLKAEKSGANTYSVVVPERGEKLEPEERAAAKAYGAGIKQTVREAQEARLRAAESAALAEGAVDAEPASA